MFGLNTLRNELARSRCITRNAVERSKEIENQYRELDSKYDFDKDNQKLGHFPEIRKNIVTNFLKELREAKTTIDNSDYTDKHRLNIIQKFLTKIHINDNQQVRG